MNKRAWLMSMAAVAGSVAAQDQEQDQEQGQLEVVTVTAERRSEDIRKVPSSISTVSGADLDVLSTGGQDVRVLRGRADFPSIRLRYTWERPNAAPQSGEETVKDMTYLQRTVPSTAAYAYEKRMLERWFVDRFASVRR